MLSKSSLSSAKNSAVTKLLWQTNLKSRNSFLLILNFLPLAKDEFADLMTTVTPLSDVGNLWFQIHIESKLEDEQ
jgi:hypothetical protein